MQCISFNKRDNCFWRSAAIDAYRVDGFVVVLFPVEKKKTWFTNEQNESDIFCHVMRKLWVFFLQLSKKQRGVDFSSFSLFHFVFICFIALQKIYVPICIFLLSRNGANKRELCIVSRKKTSHFQANKSRCFFQFKNKNRMKLKRNSTILNLLKSHLNQ